MRPATLRGLGYALINVWEWYGMDGVIVQPHREREGPSSVKTSAICGRLQDTAWGAPP